MEAFTNFKIWVNEFFYQQAINQVNLSSRTWSQLFEDGFIGEELGPSDGQGFTD